MPSKYLFNFKSDISNIRIPSKLNNPFGIEVPEIARVAAKEFQEFIEVESKNWKHDFSLQKGKMFGVLVVQKEDNTLEYLGTISGKLPENAKCNQFVPSVFDDSVGNYFINKGMTELTEIGSFKLKLVNLSLKLLHSKKIESKNQLLCNSDFLRIIIF
jgi:tRNA pseudouridine32 synthase/23S rRNA pseudouridine746 synthase